MTDHKNLAAALLAFQTEAPTLVKDKDNPGFRGAKYVPLDSIVETIGPMMAEHGLVWTTLPSHDGGQPTLDYRLIHAPTGEVLSGSMPLLLAKQDAQGLGSAITYGRRYAITSVLNLVADADDDGNAASRPAQQRQQAKRAPAPTAAPGAQHATADDVAMLKTAARGFTAQQIKEAFKMAGLEPPDPFVPATVFMRVPQHKAVELYQALGQVRKAEEVAA